MKGVYKPFTKRKVSGFHYALIQYKSKDKSMPKVGNKKSVDLRLRMFPWKLKADCILVDLCNILGHARNTDCVCFLFLLETWFMKGAVLSICYLKFDLPIQ